MSNDRPTDDELLSEVKSGSEEALGLLIDRYSAYVHAIVRSITREMLKKIADAIDFTKLEV